MSTMTLRAAVGKVAAHDAGVGALAARDENNAGLSDRTAKAVAGRAEETADKADW